MEAYDGIFVYYFVDPDLGYLVEAPATYYY